MRDAVPFGVKTGIEGEGLWDDLRCIRAIGGGSSNVDTWPLKKTGG